MQNSIPALQALRQPIEAFTPRHAKDRDFKAAMLGLADFLEELWASDGDETLESDVVWSALYAFPALTVSGPAPAELVDLAVGGGLMDSETVDTLRTLGRIKRLLRAFEPPGFAAALWRAVLLGIYSMLELFVVVDDERNTGHCFELLDTAEAMADRFMGKA